MRLTIFSANCTILLLCHLHSCILFPCPFHVPPMCGSQIWPWQSRKGERRPEWDSEPEDASPGIALPCVCGRGWDVDVCWAWGALWAGGGGGSDSHLGSSPIPLGLQWCGHHVSVAGGWWEPLRSGGLEVRGLLHPGPWQRWENLCLERYWVLGKGS